MGEITKENNISSGGHRKKSRRIESWQINAFFLILYDVFAAIGSYLLVLWLRFDCRYMEIPQNYLSAWIRFTPIYAVATVLVYVLLRLYQSIWKFASYVELRRIALSSVILGVFHSVMITALFERMPISYYILGIVVQTIMALFARFGYRFISLERRKRTLNHQRMTACRVMLIGAGAAGQLILRDMHSAREINECVQCIIDDNENNWGRFIDGVPVVGGRDDILLNVEKYRIEKICMPFRAQRPNSAGIFWIFAGKRIAS